MSTLIQIACWRVVKPCRSPFSLPTENYHCPVAPGCFGQGQSNVPPSVPMWGARVCQVSACCTTQACMQPAALPAAHAARQACIRGSRRAHDPQHLHELSQGMKAAKCRPGGCG